MLLKQSTIRNVAVLMVDNTDHISGKTGLTLTITASKDGAAFASITPTVTELATGWYNLALTTTHTNTLGDFLLHVTGTDADPTDRAFQVLVDLPGGSVSSVTGSVNSVTTGVTVTTNNDKTGYELSPAGVDDVWDEALAGHLTVGTTGKALSDAGAAGVPPSTTDIALAVWTYITRTLTAGTNIDFPTPTENADGFLDLANGFEIGLTPRQGFRLIVAACAGKLSGAASTLIRIRDVADTKDRITAVVDSVGNRNAITTDLT